MKKKPGTVLDIRVLEQARDRATAEGRPLAALIEDVLCRYLASTSLSSQAYGMITISREDLEEILQADYYDA